MTGLGFPLQVCGHSETESQTSGYWARACCSMSNSACQATSVTSDVKIRNNPKTALSHLRACSTNARFIQHKIQTMSTKIQKPPHAHTDPTSSQSSQWRRQRFDNHRDRKIQQPNFTDKIKAQNVSCGITWQIYRIHRYHLNLFRR